MSIAQIKKRFDELESYLGRDANGLNKLRELKEPVNSLRKRLACSEEARQLAEALAARRAEEVQKVNGQLVELRQEVHSLRQRVANLTRDLAEATTTAPEEAPADDYEATDLSEEQRGYREAIRKLRQIIPCCPRPQLRKPKSAVDSLGLDYYSKESFAKGWGHNDLWVLGASVAVLAAFHGAVAITAETMIRDGLEPCPEDVPHRSRHQTISWLRKNIDWSAGKVGLNSEVKLITASWRQ